MSRRQYRSQQRGTRILVSSSATISSAATAIIPAGARLISINGETDTKDTYDFTIQYEGFAIAPTTYTCKYPRVPAGKPVNLFNMFPVTGTRITAPAAEGQIRLSVIAGTGVTLRVIYTSG